jgi:hypothetical protein
VVEVEEGSVVAVVAEVVGVAEAGAVAANQQQQWHQPPIPLEMGSKGVPPSIFQGDTKLFDTFKQEWRLYRAANINHGDITVPYNRVITMLSLIKGPAVSS